MKLLTESTGVLALEDKELGRVSTTSSCLKGLAGLDPGCSPQVVLSPTTSSPKQAELHRMVVPKNSQDTHLKIKLAVRMDKPPNMKHSG